MEISAHELARTTDCKRPACDRVSLGALKGPYSGLCDVHTAEAKRQRSAGATERAGKTDIQQISRGYPKASSTLSQAAADLVKPARLLEAAVGRRKLASEEAKTRLADFNDALNAVRAAAEALIR